MVEDEALRDVLGDDVEVERNDSLFRAALVSCGRFGIITSVVVEVMRQYALYEERVESTWADVSKWIANPAIVGMSRFTQIVVNPMGQLLDPDEHSAWITRRWTAALDNAGSTPIGRAERTGANAGTQVTFDPDDPDARDSFLNRVCEGAPPVRVAIDKLIEPLEDARDAALISAGIAGAAIAVATLFGGLAPAALVTALDVALLAAASAEASILLLESVKLLAPATARLNEVLGDVSNFVATHDAAWVLHGIFDVMMGSDQTPRSTTAISYALMDIHNYRDWHCSKNGDSIEVFFDATTTDARDFIETVMTRVRELEAGVMPGAIGRQMCFPGYVAIRFMKGTTALLGMQRWPDTVSIEIASINANDGTRPFIDRIHQDAVDMIGPTGSKASIHWGQRHDADMAHVEDAFDAWVAGGRLDEWRAELSKATRNGRDAVFSTEFSRRTGLEVVQPRATFLSARPSVVCAGESTVVEWSAEDNPRGTTAVLAIAPVGPTGARRTISRPALAGSQSVEVPAGEHHVGLSVLYELNKRILTDSRSVRVRGIEPGDTTRFLLETSCGEFAGVTRWWVDISTADLTFAGGVLVDAIRLSSAPSMSWQLRRSGSAARTLSSGATTALPERPTMANQHWRFVSTTTGCTGPAPTLTIDFVFDCGP